ncbi:globoside alpha-1,3-N-acetylgalactosaminyltransferase 1-like isoform X1 [Sebastes umbrosus]|uniref:globoside alpha-1,3-N-acetylgalactosaminyltransferase 1-like isoform X1 n=1 Tax=Sebastes umbrosus TaxID=72105 RepID=UPI00189F3D62|nr:globoside alpha-1,3-N-acetylgalactosaminyltransferase 1-like isoform X1 [Sebastes umbrosus]XP_037647362.1 globoside alpha-1,3-N-acetylgalactosaminyltransferase 1-like isoform X1 [Sebastes umbrosus]
MQLINSKVVTVILLSLLLLGVLYCYLYQSRFVSFRLNDASRENGPPADVIPVSYELHLVAPDHLQYKQPSLTQGRTDVVTVTPWLAPIVWEGCFNPVLLDSIYKPKNITVAATVFAVGKYIMFLKDFLETAEKHFFVGFKVHIYVFTDRPTEVPQVKMAAGRQMTVRSVPSSNRWQEISARRMELIQTLTEDLRNHTDYIFCLDVDSRFHGRWGTESLGALVAVVHPGYYRDDRSRFPYERRTVSRAYVGPGEGDFYYCGGAFGGLLQEVHLLAKTCRSNFEADAREGIEAAWQEESHLNRYMWINKPSKVLSPEYLWQDFKPRNGELHIIRFSGVVKNYAAIRPNP